VSTQIRTISPGEHALINVLQRIVLETMDYSPAKPTDSSSYLPSVLIADAQAVLAIYTAAVPALMSDEVPA
jgi:hypothetical protein